MSTKNRLVVFLTGYDPAGPDRYYIMLRQQARYYQRRFSVPLKIGKYEKSKDNGTHFSHVSITSDWDGEHCQVDYRISDWQERVLNDAARPYWHRTLVYLFWYFNGWFNGVFLAILKWQKKFIIVFSVPLILLVLRLLTLLIFAGVGYGVSVVFGLPVLACLAPGLAAGAAVVFYQNRIFSNLYEAHLGDSLTFQCILTIKGDDAFYSEIKDFSSEITKIIEENKPDEVFLIGHSCGCFHSIGVFENIQKYLEGVSDKPQLVHLTCGSLLPFTGVYSEGFFKPIVKRLLENPNTRWVDFFAPQDPFTVPYISAAYDFGLDIKKPLVSNYSVRSAVFGEIFDQKKLTKFRYNPLRMHFQYLTANDFPGAYDFFNLISDPKSMERDFKPRYPQEDTKAS